MECRSADVGKKGDRSPKNIGSVLVFAGTGWYRRPEVPAISGWLARPSDRLKMPDDISKNPGDLIRNPSKCKVPALNNSTEKTAIRREQNRKAMQRWHENGDGVVGLHGALMSQTDWCGRRCGQGSRTISCRRRPKGRALKSNVGANQ